MGHPQAGTQYYAVVVDGKQITTLTIQKMIGEIQSYKTTHHHAHDFDGVEKIINGLIAFKTKLEIITSLIPEWYMDKDEQRAKIALLDKILQAEKEIEKQFVINLPNGGKFTISVEVNCNATFVVNENEGIDEVVEKHLQA